MNKTQDALKETVTVGGFKYEQEVSDNEVTLKFSIDLMPHANMWLLAVAVHDAFKYTGGRIARIEAEKKEREAEGVDDHVLAKMRREFDTMLKKYAKSSIAQRRSAQEAVRGFSVGDTITLSKNCKEFPGKKGVVCARKIKFLIVEIDGKRWRVPPHLCIPVGEAK